MARAGSEPVIAAGLLCAALTALVCLRWQVSTVEYLVGERMFGACYAEFARVLSPSSEAVHGSLQEWAQRLRASRKPCRA